MSYSSKNIIPDDKNNITVNGATNFESTIQGEPNRFQLWYIIENWTENDKQEGLIRLQFEGIEGFENMSVVYLPILENSDTAYFDFEIPFKCSSVTVYLSGTYEAHLELYAETTSVDTATSESTGIVRPVSTGGINVVNEDVTDADGNVTSKAGDIFINCGDGVTLTADGKLSTTSDLSGSNWQALDVYNDGFIVNGTLADGVVSGGYNFKWQTDGNLLYENANRVIRCSYNNSAKPTYVAPTEESGESNDN